jgi:Flp pilus assembly protein TadG
MRLPAFRPRKRGQSLVEMAMIAPFLVMMILMVIDCGRAVFTYSVLAGAAREGARTAITTGTSRPDNARVISAVVQNAIDLSLSGASCPNTSPVPATPSMSSNTGLIYIGPGPGNSTTNSPAGQAPAAAGACPYAVVPSYAGHYPLTVTIKYNFQPLTPFGSQFFPGGIVMTVTSTMSTEY